ncbi:MAG: nucleotide exchange factor GrpE [Planctomycetota bacterium]
MDDTTRDETVDEMDDRSELDATAHDAEVVEDDVETLRRERDEATDRLVRLQADFQNQRRHAQANIDDARRRARAEVLEEAVAILDYLDMALAAEVTTDEAKNLKVGIELTRSQMQSLFDRMDVRPITAEGAFDPSFHQAVSTVETDEVEPGTIVEVVRPGWTMGDTVLRYAQVRVAASSGESGAPGGEDA